jgi:hypothetical protein
MNRSAYPVSVLGFSLYPAVSRSGTMNSILRNRCRLVVTMLTTWIIIICSVMGVYMGLVRFYEWTAIIFLRSSQQLIDLSVDMAPSDSRGSTAGQTGWRTSVVKWFGLGVFFWRILKSFVYAFTKHPVHGSLQLRVIKTVLGVASSACNNWLILRSEGKCCEKKWRLTDIRS